MFLRRLFCLGPAPPKNRRKRTSKPATPRASPKSKGAPKKKTNRSKVKSSPSTRSKDKIPTAVRDAVWVKYHEEAKVGVCYCCNKRIQRYNAGWHCSHVVADVKGGTETVDNLRTCCAHCNLSMGDQNLYVYMKSKQLKGPGRSQVGKYLKRHPSQLGDTRTNNWIA